MSLAHYWEIIFFKTTELSAFLIIRKDLYFHSFYVEYVRFNRISLENFSQLRIILYFNKN